MKELSPKVVVLRWGHRYRDKRLTSHVALTARAFGAAGLILTDVSDEGIRKTIGEIIENWGGSFSFKEGISWKTAIREWKANCGIVVHLTVYGENIQKCDVVPRIRATRKNVLVIVGSRKVPSLFYSKKISDFNVGIGNQPHSECSSLAVFLDRFYEGKELEIEFSDAPMHVVPQEHGKKVSIRKTLRGRTIRR